MKPNFEVVNNEFCSLCEKKKLWVVKIYTGNTNNHISSICHECINQMGFEIGKAMKPENFGD